MNPALSTSQPASVGLLGRLVARPWFWALVVLPLFAGALWRGLSAPAPTLPPVLGVVPPFVLTNERGEAFGTQQLAGKPYIANFIFTTCTVACPRLTGEMLKLQHRTRNLGTGITLVSFSVDPAHDTPAVLADYAKENGAVPGRWFFVTGPLEQITQTTVEGFKIALGPDEVFGTFHGEKFVLVDGRGQIRGYYDADPAGEDAIVRDVGLLANLPGQ
jgi:protein SCO1